MLLFPSFVPPVCWAGGPPVLGRKRALVVGWRAELALVLATTAEVVGPGEPQAFGKTEIPRVLHASLFSSVLGLFPPDEPWGPLWVVGTLEPPAVGTVFFLTTGTPVLCAGRLLVLGFEGEADTSLDPCLSVLSVAFPPGAGVVGFDEPRGCLQVVGDLEPPVVGTVLGFPPITPPMLWTGWPHVPGFERELESCANPGIVLAPPAEATVAKAAAAAMLS